MKNIHIPRQVKDKPNPVLSEISSAKIIEPSELWVAYFFSAAAKPKTDPTAARNQTVNPVPMQNGSILNFLLLAELKSIATEC